MLKIASNNYSQNSKIIKNHVFQLKYLQNHKILKTGSTRTYFKSKSNIVGVFQKISQLALVSLNFKINLKSCQTILSWPELAGVYNLVFL